MTEQTFKPTITLGQLVASCLTIIGCCIFFWGSTLSRLAVLESKSQEADNKNTSVQIQMDRFGIKLDKVSDQIGTLSVSVQQALDKK